MPATIAVRNAPHSRSTMTSLIVQPLSGIALVHMGGFNATDFWLNATYVIYVMAGLCWIPVVWIQIQLKKMVAFSIETNTPLPDRYHRLFKTWFILGWPAFTGLVIIFYLMVAKPV